MNDEDRLGADYEVVGNIYDYLTKSKGCEKAKNCSKDIQTTCNLLFARITNTNLITFLCL
jgi:hypothetical protein